MANEIKPTYKSQTVLVVQVIKSTITVSGLGLFDFQFKQNKRPVRPYMMQETEPGSYQFTFEKQNFPTLATVVREGFKCDSTI